MIIFYSLACLDLESSGDEDKKKVSVETIMKKKKKMEKLVHLQAELKAQGKKLDKRNRIQLNSLLKLLQGDISLCFNHH